VAYVTQTVTGLSTTGTYVTYETVYVMYVSADDDQTELTTVTVSEYSTTVTVVGTNSVTVTST
jgi:hypothetical protein